MKSPIVEFYRTAAKSKKQRYSWRFKGGNKEITVGPLGEGFKTKQGAKKSFVTHCAHFGVLIDSTLSNSPFPISFLW